MHLHANGIDQSKVREKHKISNPSICKSQILMRDYHFDEAKVVMQELKMLLAEFEQEKSGKNDTFCFGYSDEGGVHKQYTLKDPTNLEKIFIK